MRKRLTSEVEIVIEIKKEVEILLGTNKMAIYVYHDGSLETIIWCEKVLFSKNTKILTVEKVAQIKNVDCVRVEDKIKIEEVKKSKEFLYYI